MEIDLGILFQKPEKTAKAVLTIEPLAPLSMVSTMPGSFYKTLDVPSKFHLCGAFENALGWHFDETFKNMNLGKDGKKQNLRSLIKKQVESHFKKQKIELPTWNDSDVGYEPLIEHLFETNLVVKPGKAAIIFYKDLWKQMRKRGDWGHAKGTSNLDYRLISTKFSLLSDPEVAAKIGNDKTKILDAFFKEHKGQFPLYYTTTGYREFIAITAGNYQIGLNMTESLFTALEGAFSENNIAYLGTNEGWVNLKIQRL